jgi:beta-lactamase class C
MEHTRSRTTAIVTAVLFAACAPAVVSHASENQQERQERVRAVVDMAVRPVMSKYKIPGMAVGVIVGDRTLVFDYGVASTKTRKRVTSTTLFEIGSISKTFTATLASYSQISGQLSLSDKTRKYFPSLVDTQFGDVSLLDLGTHTPGGLPLQVPEDIKTNDQLMKYFEQWRPTYAPGTYRTYANPGIGMLGLIAAKSMNQDFVALMEGRLFPMVGMKSTYINVPESRMADYAQGYADNDAPIRMAAAVLSSEAYGVKTTAADLIRFMKANLNMIELDEKLQRAITDTHTGYFQAGVMTQDLIWEQYPYPVELKTLLEGNSPAMIFKAVPVTRITPPQKPRSDVWINKTGSTNGFGAYAAFVPVKRLGVVLLANRNYPIEDRVTMAHEILGRLGSEDRSAPKASRPAAKRHSGFMSAATRAQ